MHNFKYTRCRFQADVSHLPDAIVVWSLHMQEEQTWSYLHILPDGGADLLVHQPPKKFSAHKWLRIHKKNICATNQHLKANNGKYVLFRGMLRCTHPYTCTWIRSTHPYPQTDVQCNGILYRRVCTTCKLVVTEIKSLSLSLRKKSSIRSCLCPILFILDTWFITN